MYRIIFFQKTKTAFELRLTMVYGNNAELNSDVYDPRGQPTRNQENRNHDGRGQYDRGNFRGQYEVRNNNFQNKFCQI
jgi:hypothetical protein